METTGAPLTQLYALTRLESALGAFHAALTAVAGPRPPARETITGLQVQVLDAMQLALPYLMIAPQFAERIVEPAIPELRNYEAWIRRNVRGARP